MPDIRRQLIDLGSQRAGFLAEMENAIEKKDTAAYDSAYQKLQNVNAEMTRVQTVIDEQDRKFSPISGAERKDMVEDRVNDLRNKKSIQFTAAEVKTAIRDALLVGSGQIVEPVGAGSTIHDPVGVGYSSIVNQVRALDLTGVSAWQEPYMISGLTAHSGDVKSVAGTARAESSPSFGVAEIHPFEVSVTSFVDRNLQDLSPAAYFDTVYNKAMTALKYEIASLIINGKTSGTTTFHGIATAKNKDGRNIFASLEAAPIGVDTLDELYFAYGDDDTIGANARMLLSKRNLRALGKIRGTNEKGKLYTINRDNNNANTGVIMEGGTIVPYTLASAVGEGKLLYGDPMNYLLGLFGGYTIRVDESCKAVERLITILGDVKVGGNLVVHHGFVSQEISAAASTN